MTTTELRGEARKLVAELFDGLPRDVPAVLEEPTVELLVAFAVRAVERELASLQEWARDMERHALKPIPPQPRDDFGLGKGYAFGVVETHVFRRRAELSPGGGELSLARHKTNQP